MVDIQAMIDEVYTSGGGEVVLPPGDHYVARSLMLPSGVVLSGAGPSATTLIAAPELEGAVVKSVDFDRLKGSGRWYESEGVPFGFGVTNLSINGMRYDVSDGKPLLHEEQDECLVSGVSGICFYGKRYIVDNVIIYNCDGDGFFSECSSVGGQVTIDDLPEAEIRSLWIRACSRHGFYYRGPHDGFIGKLIVSECNDDNVVFEYEKGICDGACDVMFIHSYRSHKCGIRIAAKVKASFLVGDACLQEGVYIDPRAVNGQISMIEAFLNGEASTDSQKYFSVVVDTPYLAVGVCRIRDDFGCGGLLVKKPNVQFSTLEIDGKGGGGKGLVVERSGFQAKCLIRDYSGEGGIGLYTKAVDNKNIHNQIEFKIVNCEKGWVNDVSGMHNTYKGVISGWPYQIGFDGVGPTRQDNWDIQVKNGNKLLSTAETINSSEQGKFVALDTAEEQVIKLRHALLGFTGNVKECNITLFTEVNGFSIDYIRVHSIDNDFVSIAVKLSEVAKNGKASLLVRLSV